MRHERSSGSPTAFEDLSEIEDPIIIPSLASPLPESSVYKAKPLRFVLAANMKCHTLGSLERVSRKLKYKDNTEQFTIISSFGLVQPPDKMPGLRDIHLYLLAVFHQLMF